jgi:hypothetical protein
MRPTSSRLLLLLLGATLAFAACTPHRETVNRYKYLIKECRFGEYGHLDRRPSNKEIIRDKAPSLNIGEKLVPVLEEASEYLGTPYKHGGTTHSGIDCSGLTQNCYSKAGITLPRSAADQSQYGEKISRQKPSNRRLGVLRRKIIRERSTTWAW